MFDDIKISKAIYYNHFFFYNLIAITNVSFQYNMSLATYKLQILKYINYDSIVPIGKNTNYQY